ncbi:amino acid ABC transporter substrate-binding protein [Paenisporosarcina cavernae]|uniref:Amino acid ABC transporter substrate-binding protein n=1 Tax=Paenisporosarcina cavernae TaxID=2320858 RepID=A0A385YSF7_9BACL|nr:amino acid ABC transporter substrate-binding protein [Paenisporosarcina cavernae]AYC28608.1 amino acid ABC transporter substrate-binding protein [Paenisporosarcina cavernae]
MKKLVFTITLLMGAILLTACGSDENDAATGSDTQDLLASIQDSGELLIGTEGTYPPFTFHNDEGKLTGFDVEIAEEIAKRLDVEPKFMETQWDAMFAGLDSKRFDMIVNQVGIRPDREEKYDFSSPYITSAAVLVTSKENNDVKGFDDMKGLKSAQSLTSNYADIARENGAEIVGVEGFNQAIELLNSGRVDVTVNDKLSVLDFQKQKPDANIQIVAQADDAAESGIMFRKGNESLVEAVNEALNDMIEDGTYDTISEKWFGENVLE